MEKSEGVKLCTTPRSSSKLLFSKADFLCEKNSDANTNPFRKSTSIHLLGRCVSFSCTRRAHAFCVLSVFVCLTAASDLTRTCVVGNCVPLSFPQNFVDTVLPFSCIKCGLIFGVLSQPYRPVVSELLFVLGYMRPFSFTLKCSKSIKYVSELNQHYHFFPESREPFQFPSQLFVSFLLYWCIFFCISCLVVFVLGKRGPICRSLSIPHSLIFILNISTLLSSLHTFNDNLKLL